MTNVLELTRGRLCHGDVHTEEKIREAVASGGMYSIWGMGAKGQQLLQAACEDPELMKQLLSSPKSAHFRRRHFQLGHQPLPQLSPRPEVCPTCKGAGVVFREAT